MQLVSTVITGTARRLQHLISQIGSRYPPSPQEGTHRNGAVSWKPTVAAIFDGIYHRPTQKKYRGQLTVQCCRVLSQPYQCVTIASAGLGQQPGLMCQFTPAAPFAREPFSVASETSPRESITGLLLAAERGDHAALEALFPLVCRALFPARRGASRNAGNQRSIPALVRSLPGSLFGIALRRVPRTLLCNCFDDDATHPLQLCAGSKSDKTGRRDSARIARKNR